MSLDAKSRTSEMTSSSASLAAEGDLSEEQAHVIRDSNLLKISDDALRAGFPSVAYVAKAPTMVGAATGPSPSGGAVEAIAGKDAEKGLGGADARKKPQPKKPKADRIDVLDDQVKHVLNPQTCKAIQAEWSKRLLSDIGNMEKLHVQLTGAAYSTELATEVAGLKSQLDNARQEWIQLPVPMQADSVEALGAKHRALVMNVRRLATKASAMLREPAEGKPKAKKAKLAAE